jgi:TPP-dependent pyruvate/acetoin dehydrogenase alpha subunit
MIEEWKHKDPIERWEKILTADRVLHEQNKKEMEAKIRDAIDDAVSFAEGSMPPDGGKAAEGVFAP